MWKNISIEYRGNSMIRFYNTLSRKKEEFKPLKKGVVKMYHCGPTVYARPHIGNYRAFLFADLLRRYFEYKGFEVVQVMNITDVDDKTIRDSQKEGVSLEEFTGRYRQIFFDELKFLKVKKAHHYPRATEHIEPMVELVKKLKKKGLTYESQGSIYYRIEDFGGYGKLSGLDIQGLKTGTRGTADEYDKEFPRDFALWKAWTEEDGPVFWETDLGKGRPGWHLECSAMSMQYLGETFDIHTGGVDLSFPHHENEIAQSEGATGKAFVKYWLHNEHFLLDGKKISKSEGNVILLPDLLDQGYEGETIRYGLLNSHYRTRFNFQLPDSLVSAREAVKRLRNFRREMAEVTLKGKKRKKVLSVLEKAREVFERALDDDLNTPEALGALFSMIREINSQSPNQAEAREVLLFIGQADGILGVIGEPEKETLEDQEILNLMEERKEARKNRDFKKSDEIRDHLKSLGIILEDTPQGVRWKRE